MNYKLKQTYEYACPMHTSKNHVYALAMDKSIELGTTKNGSHTGLGVSIFFKMENTRKGRSKNRPNNERDSK